MLSNIIPITLSCLLNNRATYVKYNQRIVHFIAKWQHDTTDVNLYNIISYYVGLFITML